MSEHWFEMLHLLKINENIQFSSRNTKRLTKAEEFASSGTASSQKKAEIDSVPADYMWFGAVLQNQTARGAFHVFSYELCENR